MRALVGPKRNLSKSQTEDKSTPSRTTNQTTKGAGWREAAGCIGVLLFLVYPALWSRTFTTAGRTPDQRDAFAIAKWLQRADSDGSLEKFFCPEIEPHERKRAEIEGWILGVL
jgi:hypothetical protein